LTIGNFGARFFTLIGIASVSVALLGLTTGWWHQAPRDYEECVNEVGSSDQRASLLTDCGVKFAARRKDGGGYTYFDFMQNRSFDLTGPNPSPEERKQMDREYIAYLAAERQKAIVAETKKNEQVKADLENVKQPTDSISSVGPPLVIIPKTPTSLGPKNYDRLKATTCNDDSLSCSWSKLSMKLKESFNAGAQTRR
jgi:hypothetical protein